MFYHRFHTFDAKIHMFSFCSNKRLKSFFIISFFLAGVFVGITKCDVRCLRRTQIGCSWISSEVFKTSTWGISRAGLSSEYNAPWQYSNSTGGAVIWLQSPGKAFPSIIEKLDWEQQWEFSSFFYFVYFSTCTSVSVRLLRGVWCREMTWQSFILLLPFWCLPKACCW